MSIRRTSSGLAWPAPWTGADLIVECLGQTDKHRILRLTCGGQQIDVYVSPTGKSMRVFRNDYELKEDDRA